ncbi:MAG: hypothetical protein H5T77_25475, partial [Nocardioides sp.]|nr:hypothetical protein [Nocardioides sp.]
LNRMYPKSLVKPQLDTIMVPRPVSSGFPAKPLDGPDLLDWARVVIDAIIDPLT